MIGFEDKTKITVSYLPDGEALIAKNIPSTNLYKLLDSFTLSFVLYCKNIDVLKKIEMNPGTTETLISRWEKEYGLPDKCLKKTDDLEQRRTNLLIKIGMNGVQTVQDFEDLAAKFGYDVNVIPAAGSEKVTFPLQFPWSFMTEKGSKFTLIVDMPSELGRNTFPFDVTKFPFPFGTDNGNIIECVFKRLVPSNVNVIFRYIL